MSPIAAARSTRCSRSRISSTAAAPAHIASLPVNVKNMKPLPRSASTMSSVAATIPIGT